MKRNAVFAISILLLVVLASGCTSSNNNSTTNSSQGQNNSTVQTNQNITIQINSDSSWSGTLTYNNGTQMINGNGNATYNLGPNPGTITIKLHKTSNRGAVNVQIIKNGNVVVNQTTSGSPGNMNINYSSY